MIKQAIIPLALKSNIIGCPPHYCYLLWICSPIQMQKLCPDESELGTNSRQPSRILQIIWLSSGIEVDVLVLWYFAQVALLKVLCSVNCNLCLCLVLKILYLSVTVLFRNWLLLQIDTHFISPFMELNIYQSFFNDSSI